MKTRSIFAFEYGTLKVGSNEDELNENEFKSLCRYFEKGGKKYFSIGYNKIRFKNYVGIIQVDGLTIEVLPKVDRNSEDPEKWHNALLFLLRYTKKIRFSSTKAVNLDYTNQSFLDLYFEEFIFQAEQLFNEGLRKKYKAGRGNLNSLKGRILFDQQIKKNNVNKARFYCSYQDFSLDYKIHWAIKKALKITVLTAKKDKIKQKAKSLLLILPEEIKDDIKHSELDSIILDRTTKRYEPCLTLASMIIKSYCPIMTFGQLPVLALMFDMNYLFEDFIFNVMKKSISELGYEVHRRKKKFWKTKEIKPDLTITKGDRTIILDTKWKVPQDGVPSDSDLKQVFVYNHFFESSDSILLYPWSSVFQEVNQADLYGIYHKPLSLKGLSIENSCRVETINFFNEDKQFDIDSILNSLRSIVLDITSNWKD